MSFDPLNKVLALASAGPTPWEPYRLPEFLDAFLLKTLLARNTATPAATLAALAAVGPKQIHQSLHRLMRSGLVERRAGTSGWHTTKLEPPTSQSITLAYGRLIEGEKHDTSLSSAELNAMDERFRKAQNTDIRRKASKTTARKTSSESASAQASVRQVKALQEAQNARQAAGAAAKPGSRVEPGPYAILKGKEAALVRISLIADGNAYVVGVKASTGEEVQDKPLVAVPVSKILVFEKIASAKAFAKSEGIEFAGEEATARDLETLQKSFANEMKRSVR